MRNNNRRNHLEDLIEENYQLLAESERDLPLKTNPIEREASQRNIDGIKKIIKSWETELDQLSGNKQLSHITEPVVMVKLPTNPTSTNASKWRWFVFGSAILFAIVLIIAVFQWVDADQQRKDATQLRATLTPLAQANLTAQAQALNYATAVGQAQATITAIANVPPLTAMAQATQARIAELDNKVKSTAIVDISNQLLTVDTQYGPATIDAVASNGLNNFTNFKAEADFYIPDNTSEKGQWSVALDFRITWDGTGNYKQAYGLQIKDDGYSSFGVWEFNGTPTPTPTPYNRLAYVINKGNGKNLFSNSETMPTQLILYVFDSETYFCLNSQKDVKSRCKVLPIIAYPFLSMTQPGNIRFSVWNDNKITGKNNIMCQSFKVWRLE
jgi:hypothetical protein